MVDQQGDPLLNSLVAAYLAKVAPKIGATFQKTVKVKLFCNPCVIIDCEEIKKTQFPQGGVAPDVTVGLKEVVQHFSNTAPPQKRAGLGSGGKREILCAVGTFHNSIYLSCLRIHSPDAYRS